MIMFMDAECRPKQKKRTENNSSNYKTFNQKNQDFVPSKTKQKQGEEKPRMNLQYSWINRPKNPKRKFELIVICHRAVEWSQPERAAVLLHSQLPMQLSLKLTSAASQVFHLETEIQSKAQRLETTKTQSYPETYHHPFTRINQQG